MKARIWCCFSTPDTLGYAWGSTWSECPESSDVYCWSTSNRSDSDIQPTQTWALCHWRRLCLSFNFTSTSTGNFQSCARGLRHEEKRHAAISLSMASIGCAITQWPFAIGHRAAHFSRINRLVINFRTNNRDWLWPPTVGPWWMAVERSYSSAATVGRLANEILE